MIEPTMTDSTSNKKSSQEPEMKALFQGDFDADDDAGNDTSSFAEGFKDRVREVHEKFDEDGDGYLSFSELTELQLTTEGARLTEANYLMACKALDCHPSKGISLDALRLTYAAQGTSIEKDYYKVFPERKKPKVEIEGEDHVYEVGADGVDISD